LVAPIIADRKTSGMNVTISQYAVNIYGVQYLQCEGTFAVNFWSNCNPGTIELTSPETCRPEAYFSNSRLWFEVAIQAVAL
jgi:hypothetical protein